jgi:MuDR family transposase
MQVGQVYGSIDGFKGALRNWAIADHFEYRWKFSDSQRCKAVCVH